MSGSLSTVLATGALSLGFVATASAQVVASVGPSNDTWIRDGFSHVANGVDPALNNLAEFVPYIQFDLSGLSIDEVSAATLTLNKVAASRNDGLVNGRFGVQGLPNIPGNTLQNWHETADFDPTDAANGLDFRNVGLEWGTGFPDGVDYTRLINLDADTGANVVEVTNNTTGIATLTGPDLVQFLNDRVDDNGLVTFLLPFPDGTANNRGFGWASKENTAGLGPVLALTYSEDTVIPEPASLGLLGVAGLALLRRRIA